MKQKKQPQVKVQQQKAEALKRKICDLLGWDELQYCYYQYEQGLSYLYFTLKNDAVAINYLERDAHFWGWWKNLWMSLDEKFVDETSSFYYNLHQRRNLYRKENRGHAISSYKPLDGFLIRPILQQFKLRQSCKQ